MNADAIELMLNTGRMLAPKIVKAESEPPHVYYRQNIDVSLTKVYAEPIPRSHRAISLAAIIEKAKDGLDAPEIWYSRHGVTLFIDGGDRRDRVMLELPLSEQILKLQEWARLRPAMQQSHLIKELRITFRDSLSTAGQIVDILRKVRFNATQAADITIQHGKTSLGKALTAEVTATKDLPEYLKLWVPVFAVGAFRNIRGIVECALEPDPQSTTFQLIPLPGQIEAAVTAAEEDLGAQLREALKDVAVGIYYGCP